MLPAAHASDGFGSIRAPAACCGLVGLKPTRGRNTMAPYLGEGLSGLATEHAVSLSVRDSAAILDATRAPGAGDPYSAAPPDRPFLDEAGTDPGRLRIAFTRRAPNGAPVEADAIRVLEETASLAAELGHRVEEADPAIDGAAVVPTFLTLMAVNTAVNLSSHPSAGRAAREDEVERITWLSAKMNGGADPARQGLGSRPRSPGYGQTAAERDLLPGSSFSLTAETDGKGFVSIWGRGAMTRFSGREPAPAQTGGDLSVDGEMASGLLGAAWTRGRWTTGLLVTHSLGEGATGRQAAPDRGPGQAARCRPTVAPVMFTAANRPRVRNRSPPTVAPCCAARPWARFGWRW